MKSGRVLTTAAVAGLLMLAAFPFIVMFPDPPAFGPEGATLLAAIPIVATAAEAWHAEAAARGRILRWAGVVFAGTAGTIASSMALHGAIPAIPTLDLLAGLFGLEGEDADPAILFEAWCELWLFWALVAGLLARLLPRRPASAPSAPSPWHEPRPGRGWNLATILLWCLGWCAVAGTVVEGHRVAAFLARASHAEGRVANDDAHPLIRFTAANGVVVTFRQNGGISRAVGATVPVAYDEADPQGTAQADTVFVTWGDVAGLAWLGLSFTLFPFFGLRAAFGRR